jgi:hypothetical protein
MRGHGLHFSLDSLGNDAVGQVHLEKFPSGNVANNTAEQKLRKLVVLQKNKTN